MQARAVALRAPRIAGDVEPEAAQLALAGARDREAVLARREHAAADERVGKRHAGDAGEVVVARARRAQRLAVVPLAQAAHGLGGAIDASASSARATSAPASRTWRVRPRRSLATSPPDSSRARCSVAVDGAIAGAPRQLARADRLAAVSASSIAARDGSAISAATAARSASMPDSVARRRFGGGRNLRVVRRATERRA